MLALPIFPGRLSIVPPLRNSPVDCRRQKKAPTCVEACVLALPIFPGRPSIVPPLRNSPVDCFRRKNLLLP